MEREFTAVFEQDGEWFIGWVEELPAAFGQGKSLDDARDDLREAIKLVLETDPDLVHAPRRQRITEKLLVAV